MPVSKPCYVLVRDALFRQKLHISDYANFSLQQEKEIFKMNCKLCKFVLSALLISLTGTAHAAISLGFNPEPQSGNQINVGLTISGLNSGSAPSLSTYDLDIKFDDSHLAFASATFGDPVLGNQLDLLNFGANLASSDLTGSGILNMFELSLDSVSDLDGLQADSFTLATLTFDVLSAGTTQLAIAINALADAEGNALTANTATASITTTVPLPSAFFMMLPGLAGVFRRAKTKRKFT
jgi:hypothetical protein